MRGGRWFKNPFFRGQKTTKYAPFVYNKAKYVCLPTPGAPLESSGSFGLWLLSLSISLLACSWSSVSISSFSSSVFSAFSSSSASDFWDLLLSDSSASDFWDLLLSDVISPSLVSSEASSLIPAEANLAWKKFVQFVMFYVKLIILYLESFQSNLALLWVYLIWFPFTGKSFSEALIFASTNPQYDKRLFIESRVQCMKITSSDHVCFCVDIQNN